MRTGEQNGLDGQRVQPWTVHVGVTVDAQIPAEIVPVHDQDVVVGTHAGLHDPSLPHDAGVDTRKRSCVVIAPQTPYFSGVFSACSRHTASTGQSRQMRFACSSRSRRIRRRGSSSGKKSSAENSWQLPRSCQLQNAVSKSGADAVMVSQWPECGCQSRHLIDVSFSPGLLTRAFHHDQSTSKSTTNSAGTASASGVNRLVDSSRATPASTRPPYPSTLPGTVMVTVAEGDPRRGRR